MMNDVVFIQLKYKDGLLTDDLRYYYLKHLSHTIFYYDERKMIIL